MDPRRFDVRSVAGGRSVGAVVLCATLLLTACGGSDKKSTPTPTKPAATVAAPTTAAGSTSGNTTPSAAATTASGSTSGNKTPSAEATTDVTALAATFNAEATQATGMVTKAASFVGKIDACKLVSRSDAEKIIGKKLSGDPFYGIEGFSNSRSFCNYNPESVPGTAVVDGTTIQLVALTSDDLKTLGFTESDIKKFWDDTKTSAKESEGYQEISGIGDDAFFTTTDGLSVRKGDTAIAVRGLPLDKAKDFAKKALDNL